MLTLKVGNMIKCTLILISLLLSSLGQAQTSVLHAGDILLQPLDCWSCHLIEEEDNTIYSHIGIVLATTPEVLVAEALGRVKTTKLSEFMARTKKGQKISVRRLKDTTSNFSGLQKIYVHDFEGRKYDHEFLWENIDENGQEKLYCSEFVAKILEAYLEIPQPIKRMHFEKNLPDWTRFFKGHIPEGEWGNSPGDFERSEIFYDVGEI